MRVREEDVMALARAKSIQSIREANHAIWKETARTASFR
jgi:hypothetical protein